MWIDLKMIRSENIQNKIQESEKARGTDAENFNLVLELDKILREKRKNLDSLNTKLNQNHKIIKQLKLSNKEIPQSLISENTDLEKQQKMCIQSCEDTNNNLLSALNLIGNIADPIYTSEIPKFRPISSTSELFSSALIKKQSFLTQFFNFFHLRGYNLTQTPSLGLSTLLSTIFPTKKFAKIPAKKAKVLLPGPIYAIIPAYFQEKLDKTPQRLITYGTYFNHKLKQSEVLSLIIFTNSQNWQDSERSIINDTQAFINSQFSQVCMYNRPASLLSKSASHQIDFALPLPQNQYTKVCTFTNFTTYLSNKAKIRCLHNEAPIFLLVKFKDFSLFLN